MAACNYPAGTATLHRPPQALTCLIRAEKALQNVAVGEEDPQCYLCGQKESSELYPAQGGVSSLCSHYRNCQATPGLVFPVILNTPELQGKRTKPNVWANAF